MKKIIIILLSVISFTACTSDFDPKLYGTLSPSTFPSNAAEYELYTLELYKPFYSKWGYNGASSWEGNFFSPEWGHIVMFDGSTDLMPVFSNWGSFWQGFTSIDFTFMKTQGRGSHFEKVRFVTRATKIINDIQNAPALTDAKKTALIAEAKMARGWIMYYLLHIYGPVPVILDPAKIGTSAEADLTRPSRTDFVASIASDLRYAADNLPVSPANYGRFNKGCALTALARLYLNEKNFVSAESTCREIVSMNKYSLVSDYASLFRESTEKNTETIWAVSCVNGTQNGNFNAWAYYCYPTDYVGNKIPSGWGGTTGVLSATWTFYDSFDQNDTRRQLLIAQYKAKDGTTVKNRTNMLGAVIAKYKDEGGLENSVQGNDIVVCRYADVLLMLAEAINENSGPTAEAVGYVNQVRERAGVKDVTIAEKTSKDTFRDMLFIERGHELYFEGLRKMDLIRMDKISSALSSVGKTVPTDINKYKLFPLPDYAINNSDGQLVQNLGY
jgi:hypothetical protein